MNNSLMNELSVMADTIEKLTTIKDKHCTRITNPIKDYAKREIESFNKDYKTLIAFVNKNIHLFASFEVGTMMDGYTKYISKFDGKNKFDTKIYGDKHLLIGNCLRIDFNTVNIIEGKPDVVNSIKIDGDYKSYIPDIFEDETSLEYWNDLKNKVDELVKYHEQLVGIFRRAMNNIAEEMKNLMIKTIATAQDAEKTVPTEPVSL